ncbi:MAG TPA: helix-turn-helix domain-containing protein, partial [Acidimicrobiia bacterium]|nr:helix-turn-helix domain-containing protein [Acidimicrobiia bacterium]
MSETNVRRGGSPEYRVEELAAAANVSVEVLRSYQSKGLLPPPRHEGREARYGPHHLERLRRILDLKDRGYSLKAIAGVLARGWGVDAPSRTDPAVSSDDELLTL